MSAEKTERNLAVIEAVRKGEVAISALGARFGICTARVIQIAREHGVSRGFRHDGMTAEAGNVIRRTYRQTGVIARAAEAAGVPHSTAYSYLQRGGLLGAPKSRSSWSEEEDAVIRRNYRRPGQSAASIGAGLGRTRDEVIGRAARLGLAKRKKTR